MSYDILPIPAFQDNYIWLIRAGRSATVVDPGDAAPVIALLEAEGLKLDTVLVTHHHADHIGGLGRLIDRYRPLVYGPRDERISGLTQFVREGERIELPAAQIKLRVIEVPGHTRSHVAYYGGNAVFCGDTLFACGCGRLFEGSPAQMAQSLAKLARLPGETRVYCAHEYTLSNIRFALAAEPDNANLQGFERTARTLRAQGIPTVPTTIAEELATNPFLRCTEPRIVSTASAVAGKPLTDPVEVLAVIREWKNRF